MSEYDKPYTNVEEQINILKQRGMIIQNEDTARDYLYHINYYRLSGYSYPFRADNDSEDFRPDTKFENIIELYIFDKRLRMLLLDEIERIEISLRTTISLEIGMVSKDAHRHYNSGIFGNWEGNQEKHQDWLKRIDEREKSAQDHFAKHFREKYQKSAMPVWISSELWSFGDISHFFRHLTAEYKDKISNTYSIEDRRIFITWLRNLNLVRNICAHHSRLWNKDLITPSLPKIEEFQYITALSGIARSRIYTSLTIILFLLQKISDSPNWKNRLKEHLESFPQTPHISLRSSGFPEDWQQQKIWQ